LLCTASISASIFVLCTTFLLIFLVFVPHCNFAILSMQGRV
jgi:hypothetical protein